VTCLKRWLRDAESERGGTKAFMLGDGEERR
jgi:hypothetical protein